MSDFPIITILTLVPLLGGFIVLGLGSAQSRFARPLALSFSFLALALVGLVWKAFDLENTDLQFVERHPWITALNAEYFVGVDGLSLVMIVLSALVTPMAMFCSPKTTEKAQLYFGLFLLLEAGLFGTFTALSFVHWFLFWELSLVPAFFLVKLWGGSQRGPAATQFFVYTMVGSVAMLLAFLAIYLATGKFDFPSLAELGQANRWSAYFNVRLGWYSISADTITLIIFGGVFLGFAVKVPLVPFHTWLPATYAEAPTGTTMVLTGLMSKMGVYGFLRILLPLFPEQVHTLLTPLLWLTILTIVCSAAAAFAQRDLKRLFAYSSINHLGYCLLGVLAVAGSSGNGAHSATDRAAALDGVILQMFNHGLTAVTLFAFLAFFERRSGGLRGVDDFGGLRKVAPVFCGLMGISMFASLGLPGLNGFVGEFLIFKGTFALTAWAAALATPGLLITAIFLLRLLERVFNGPLNPKWANWPDLTWRERAIIVPATVLMFALGVYPRLLTDVINPTVTKMIEQFQM